MSELSGHQNYIPFRSCQVYNAQVNECTASNICSSCWHRDFTCMAVRRYPNITVAEYGQIPTDLPVHAETNIMKVSHSRKMFATPTLPASCSAFEEWHIFAFAGSVCPWAGCLQH